MRKDNCVGLVTVTNYNYGSILQTFALQQVIRQNGRSTQIVRYSEGKIAKIKRFQNLEYAKSKMK